MWLIVAGAAMSVITGARLVVSAFVRDDRARGVPQARVVRDGHPVRDRQPLETAARLLGGAFLVVIGIVAMLIVLRAPT